MSLIVRTKSIETGKLTATESALYKYLKFKVDKPELNEPYQVGSFTHLYGYKSICNKSNINVDKMKTEERDSFNTFITMLQNVSADASTLEGKARAIKDIAQVFNSVYDALDENGEILTNIAIDTYDKHLYNMLERLVKTIMPRNLHIEVDSFREDAADFVDVLIKDEEGMYELYREHLINGLYEMVVNIVKGVNETNIEACFYQSELGDTVVKLTLPIFTEVVYFTSFSIPGLYGESSSSMGPGLHVIKTGNPIYKYYEPLLGVTTHDVPATQFLLYANNQYRQDRTCSVFVDRLTGNFILFF